MSCATLVIRPATGQRTLVTAGCGTFIPLRTPTQQRLVQTVLNGRAVVTVAQSQGRTGPQGPVGPSGGALVLTAGETVSALKMVYELGGEVFALDSQDAANIYRWVGVAVTAGTTGNDVTVQRSGELEDNSWSWTDGERVYLGASGTLTQVPPVVGYYQLVGTAVSPKRVLLNIQDPIEL